VVKKLTLSFVIGGLYAGIAYLLWISKLEFADSLLSIPLVLSHLLARKERGWVRGLGAFLGVMAFYGSKAQLLTSGALWRILLEGIGAWGLKGGRLGIIIAPIAPALYWLMVKGAVWAGVNYALTVLVLTTTRKREG